MGFALAGVPHLVILVDDLERVDVVGRGRPLRRHQSLRAGANVNFVQPAGDGLFRYRTYERGVEAETLACGTGSVAVAAMLAAWGETGDATSIRTRSGLWVHITLRRQNGELWPSLGGEGRIVFRGELPAALPGLG